jgi:pyruvate ferredoxin oxidoreductase gamma subunit
MWRIRFHGRGGQGMKTASRILGTALFVEGFEVQDAPRYGAERRGAPIFAYVRADRRPIDERGIIRRPDLVVVADDSLVTVPAAGVLSGVDEHSVLLIYSAEGAEVWHGRLNGIARIVVSPLEEMVSDTAGAATIDVACAAAAARLLGVVSQGSLVQAVQTELEHLGEAAVAMNVEKAIGAYAQAAAFPASVIEGQEVQATGYLPPDWVEIPFEDAGISAPVIHGGLTSLESKTGLWRTLRPVLDYDHCKGCWWICGSLCPDGAIRVEEGRPVIDYDHCKGCMVCVAVCPTHAILAESERTAGSAEEPT